MANFVYTTAKKGLMDGTIDLTGDIRVMLCMSNTTADEEEDTTFIDQFTTLDEHDGANYVRKALASGAVTNDDANDRGEFDAADVVWTALGAGTRAAAGLVLYLFVSDDTDSVPIAWIDDGAPFSPNGGNVTYQWNAEGIIQLT